MTAAPAYPDDPARGRARSLSTETPTSEHPLAAVAPPPPAAPRRRRSPLSLLGILVSVVALGGVVYWALQQDAPTLPDSPAEIAALIGAIALYGLATVVRSERWQRLLVDEKAKPHRADTYALTVVGYAGNNILPARAGDAIRVVLMAPRAECSKRTVVGTLLAERLLDVAVLLVIFVVVGYGLLGEVGGELGRADRDRRDRRRSPRPASAGASCAATRSCTGCWRRSPPPRSACAAPTTGCCCSAMTLVIWAIEAGVWMSVGAAVGFKMDPIEGLYLVALASVFSLIPSGPGYAGTQDAAVTIGIKALGGHGRDRGRLPADAALRDRRADHHPWTDPACRPLRRAVETALRARRGQELTVTDTASLTKNDHDRDHRPRPAPPHARGLVRRPGRRASWRSGAC